MYQLKCSLKDRGLCNGKYVPNIGCRFNRDQDVKLYRNKTCDVQIELVYSNLVEGDFS